MACHAITKPQQEAKMEKLSELEVSSVTGPDADQSGPVDDEIITGPEVDSLLRISPSTRWRWTKLGRLPKPFRLHPHGQNLYRKREIRALIDSAPAVETYRNCG